MSLNHAASSESKKILNAKNITVSFDGFKALNALDFAMNHGELRFVIGPNGAGKTTFLDVVTGRTRPFDGKIHFDEQLDVLPLAEHQRARHGIARKFQTPTVFGSLSVYENLEAASGFRDRSLRLFRPVSPHHKEQIDSTLELIGLQDRKHVKAGILAHGEKQWLEIGMLLVQSPKLLLLDEPVAGMTRRERNRTGELLQAIAQKCSVLVVEHDMEFVRNFATTVSVLHMGALLCEGPVEQVQNDSRVIEVYLGRSHRTH